MADLDSGAPSPADPAVDATPEPTLAEHEAEFGTVDKRPQPDPEGEPEEDSRRPPRDRDDKGQFVKPTEKHRAAKQEAGARDVPRIQELTRKLREAETERDALRARPAPALGTQSAPVEKPAPGPSQVPRGTSAAERDWNREVARYKGLPGFPKTDNFQEFGDAMLAQDLFIREHLRAEEADTWQKAQESNRIAQSWRERVDGAKARYEDFEQVALLSPTSIPQGSLIDAWILEHKSGADVLYSLQKDPAELRRILALPMFEQVDALSLIGQRLSGTRTAAVSTGAAPATRSAPAPRPITPVRTSAPTADDEPPDPEKASLKDFERYYHKDRR